MSKVGEYYVLRSPSPKGGKVLLEAEGSVLKDEKETARLQ